MRVEGSNNIPKISRPNISGANTARTSRSANNNRPDLADISTQDYMRENALSQDELEEHIDEVEHELEKLNDTMRTFDRGLNFELHEDSGRHMVQVMDLVEDEIIREIPPEQVLDLSAKINEMIGLVIDVRI